jgi:hypothetical protein
MSLILDGTNGLSDVDGSASTPAIRGTDTNTGIFFPAADTIAFAEGGAEVARFDSSGRLGVNTTSPTVNLEIGSNNSTVKALAVRYSSVPVYLSNSFDGTLGLSTLSTNNYNTSSGSSSWSSFENTSYGSSAVQLAVSTGGADIRFLTASASNTNPSERMRIDSTGNVLINKTGRLGGEKLSVESSGAGNNTCAFVFNSTDDRSAVLSYHAGSTGGTSRKHYAFLNNVTTEVGFIGCTGSATTYSTSSDYRLKDNIAPMTGALAKVSALKPVTYTWKSTGETSQGFIAHELQAVVPDCVTGEKDAVDEEGNPKYQGIDTSFLVATLTAAIQEQQAIITDLKARIETLEAK